MRIVWRCGLISTLQNICIIFNVLVPAIYCQYTVSCVFNLMCTCKIDELRADATCIKVPFYRLPALSDRQYTHIDIMESNLEAVENESFGMIKIESIRLMNNQIVLIEPKAFTYMQNNLRSLDLSFNLLTDFPYKALNSLNNLDWLNLNSNEIASLNSDNEFYDGWETLKGTLQTLFLSGNDISDISKDDILSEFYRLTWLNIDHNLLKTVKFQNFPITLRTLSVCYNQIVELPIDIIENLSELSRFYLRGNYIRQLPLNLFANKKRLEKLDLGENIVDHIIPSSVNTALITIRDLNLDFNKIKFIPAHCFRGLSITKLYLSRNRISKIDSKGFIDLTNSLEYLDLENNELSEIPSSVNFLKRLKYLYVSSNKIQNISENIFPNTLKAISLSGNQLLEIPSESLKQCNKLSHLNLGYNFIREIEFRDFENWSENLDTLLLRNNKLSEITDGTFQGTKKLRELSLSFNKIINIQDNGFLELQNSLESLEISFGLFQDEFFGNFLKPLNSLLWLALDNNNIHVISNKAFHSLENLQYVNLDCNHISKIPNRLFRSEIHRNLREIRLSNNHLIEIDSNSFLDLFDLSNIVLCRNQVNRINSNGFKNLPNLLNLLLARNQISKIENEAFVNLPNLLKLDLQNNFLKILNLNSFSNVSNKLNPFTLNVSNNLIDTIDYNDNLSSSLNIGSIDLSFNELLEVPGNFRKIFKNILRNLDLSFNKIRTLNSGTFSENLSTISLKENNIFYVHMSSFTNLKNLQILDLSGNSIEYLHMDTFNTTTNLRILNLSKNEIRILPKNLFYYTNLENLDLSTNWLTSIPNLSLIKNTLRKFDISSNKIEHLDSTMFNDVPNLFSLNLARNKLKILADNVFASVPNLLELNLSYNKLSANFKELFHYIQKLRKLDLSVTNQTTIPQLPLPNLISVYFSNNQITKIEKSFFDTFKLRHLYLDNNLLTGISNDAWTNLPILKELDISKNPIKILKKEDFSKLPKLQILNIQYLEKFRNVDENLFSENSMLSILKLDMYTNLENRTFHLGNTLSTVRSLRKISVRVLTEKLTNQLNGIFHPKLKELEITGENLKHIRRDAFRDIGQTSDLILRIRHTSIEDLPIGLFEGIQNIAHLSLDLSDNQLLSLHSSILYHNVTNWENIGTKILQGGLVLKNNPWICDCGLVWLGHWMRRWLRESLEIHTLILEEAQQMENIAREATCLDQRTNKPMPIVDLHLEDLSCQASALSGNGSHLLGTHLLACSLRTIIIFTLSKIFWIF